MKKLNYFILTAASILLLLNIFNGSQSGDFNYASIISNVLLLFVAAMSLRESKNKA